MEEKILIGIEIQKGDGEKQIDALTRSITDLQIATANLKKENNELIKNGQQNSQQYIENTRQIEINKQKINEATASRKGLIQTLAAEENSIKALRIENANLAKQRDLVTTVTKEGRDEIARLNAVIDKNNEVIEENLDKAGKQKAAIGGYTNAIKDSIPFFRQAEQAQAALGGGLSTLNKIFLASGIGLFIGALIALIQWVKRTEEGGDALNKVMFTIDAILGNIGDAAAAVGKYLFDAFNNPKQALEDFGAFLRDQIVNRFTGLLTLIPRLASAIDLLFSGEFEAAARVAGDAVGQVVLGIENATDKVLGFIDGIAASVDDAIKQGERLAQLDKLLGDQEEALTVQRAKTALEVAKLREDALKQEGDARKKILEEAIALEQRLSDAEVAHAVTRLKLAKEQQEVDGVTDESKLAIAQAEADIINAQSARFQQTLRFQKEIAAIDEATRKEQAALLAEANKILEENEKKELERQARIQEALVQTEELRLEQAVVNAQSIEDRIDREIELETFKTFALLENQTLLEEERQLIIEESQAKINAIIVKGTAERIKKEETEEKRLSDLKRREREAEVSGKSAVANASVALLREVFGENKLFAIAQVGINTAQAIVNALAMSGPPWIGIAMAAIVGALGAAQSVKIAATEFAKGGFLKLKKMARGGDLRRGGVFRGALHRDGGIPFTVNGQGGYEAEDEEIIINRKSSKMFRPLLSQINVAGGGVPFQRGGVTRFQNGSTIGTTQTRIAHANLLNRVDLDRLAEMINQVQPVLVLQDFEAKQSEVNTTRTTATII